MFPSQDDKLKLTVIYKTSQIFSADPAFEFEALNRTCCVKLCVNCKPWHCFRNITWYIYIYTWNMDTLATTFIWVLGHLQQVHPLTNVHTSELGSIRCASELRRSCYHRLFKAPVHRQSLQCVFCLEFREGKQK